MFKKILIIDDDYHQRHILRTVLEKKHSSSLIVEAADGGDALWKIRQQDFDLIICDNYIPKKKGLDIISDLITHHNYSPDKFIFMSGDIEEDEVKILAKLGVKSILLKPISLERLTTQVSKSFNLA